MNEPKRLRPKRKTFRIGQLASGEEFIYSLTPMGSSHRGKAVVRKNETADEKSTRLALRKRTLKREK